MIGFPYGTLEIEVFDNTEGVGTCVSCGAFGGAWVYCPVFNHIMKAKQIGNLTFDETGELNRCELFTKRGA